MCYMNSKTELFYLKARAENAPISVLSTGDVSKSIPRELIVIDIEQPTNLGNYEFVDFFVTGWA